MNIDATRNFCHEHWQNSVLPELIDYIKIPNKSPMFDAEWQTHGYMDQAVAQFERWCLAQNIPGMQLEVVRLPGRTPLLYMDIPGSGDETLLLYGHLDKQPEMSGWREDLGPWKPVIEDDKLYGRGGADDGYATFASLLAIKALQEQNIPHARCVVIIEACEESGSFDLPFYIDHLAERIGKPELVICLDSGCGNYEQLWNTTSLRGLVGGELSIEILDEGVHSGDASGVVPCSFRILRQLLDRIEEANSGVISANEFNVSIPRQRIEQAELAAEVLQEEVYTKFPFTGSAQASTNDLIELILNRTWRPALAITGADGLPQIDDAGNVLRPFTSVKISMRIPPTCDGAHAGDKLKQLLESDPPYGAKVSFTPDWDASGWHAPALQDWLKSAIDDASVKFFGAPAVHMGEGGSIPFMGMLGEKFPEAQFLITGVLGPQSNAHGPNEFLHIPTAEKLTCCVAEIIARHYEHATAD
ncbi:MAG: M20/M25/M40 family metallo-hydrolase [Gammaproteobacteria bacterium]|nr:M20/M25/M40 family metallo-hydrolase [Gammaproteobacteria bacterium]